MGNCCRHESSMTWAGEDWGAGTQESVTLDHQKTSEVEKNLLSSHDDDDHHKNGNSSSSTEVKIRITKKQLEELLGKIDVQDLSVEQILAQLMNATSTHDHCNALQRSWRPALQSIPEVN